MGGKIKNLAARTMPDSFEAGEGRLGGGNLVHHLLSVDSGLVSSLQLQATYSILNGLWASAHEGSVLRRKRQGIAGCSGQRKLETITGPCSPVVRGAPVWGLSYNALSPTFSHSFSL